MIGEVTNHLWQSTLFALAAALLTLAFRRNRAQVRYWLWLSASLKFLLPFALLMDLGSRLPWLPATRNVAANAVSFTMVQIAQPFPGAMSFAPSVPHNTDWLPIALLGLWACGFAVIVFLRCKDWFRIRATVKASTPLLLRGMIASHEPTRSFPSRQAPAWRSASNVTPRQNYPAAADEESAFPERLRVVSTAVRLEPGAFGIFYPVLLLPAGILNRLSPPELEAVLAHELCHVRRRDNLTAAIHMLVEAIFWFHPLVWWIGARLVEERERACDEEVLRLGSEAHVYAESILKVCKLYLESPLACVSGVTGSDLKKRIERIMNEHLGAALTAPKKLLLTTAGAVALIVPLVSGVLAAPRLRAQSPVSQSASGDKRLLFEVASIKANKSGALGGGGGRIEPGGRWVASNRTLRQLVTFAYLLSPAQERLISGTADWIDSEHFDIEAKSAMSNPTREQVAMMARSLLANRFKLVVHIETRQLPVFALVLAKDGKLGPQLLRHSDNRKCGDPSPPSTPGIPCSGDWATIRSGKNHLAGNNNSMDKLLEALMIFVDRPVLDRTGLSGTFDFTIDFEYRQIDPYMLPSDDPSNPTQAPSVFTALKDQLGLELKSEKGPVDVIVIDHVEQPSPN